MSVNDAVIGGPGQQAVEVFDTDLVSLNEIFNERIKKALQCYTLPDLIVRCDSMPVSRAVKEKISLLFDKLIGMIFRSNPNGRRLFLYVECEPDHTVESNTGGDEMRNYILKFHTNLTTDDNWKKLHEHALSASNEIISTHNWKFVVNNINHTGCLFAITVPGKFE